MDCVGAFSSNFANSCVAIDFTLLLLFAAAAESILRSARAVAIEGLSSRLTLCNSSCDVGEQEWKDLDKYIHNAVHPLTQQDMALHPLIVQPGWSFVFSPVHPVPFLFYPTQDLRGKVEIARINNFAVSERNLTTLGFRLREIAMLWPSLLKNEMGDLVLAINAAFSSGLRLWFSETQKYE